MALSKSQKARLYGENTQAESKKPVPSQVSRPARRPLSKGEYTHRDMRAEPEKNSSFMFAGVAFVIGLLLFGYYHFWLLPELGSLAGVSMPEARLWFNADDAFAINQGMGADNIVQYQAVHRSTGLILPLILAAGWLGMISASKFELAVRRAMMMVPLAYAVIFIVGGFVIDMAIANPNGPVGLAALLVLLRWILFALMLAQLIFMAIRLVRGKLNAFAAGELPEQRRG